MDTTSLSKKTQDLAEDVSGSSAVEHVRRSMDEARAGAEELVNDSNQAFHRVTSRARETIENTNDQAAQYVQAQPLKSLLLALAAGAGIALLATALSKHHNGRN